MFYQYKISLNSGSCLEVLSKLIIFGRKYSFDIFHIPLDFSLIQDYDIIKFYHKKELIPKDNNLILLGENILEPRFYRLSDFLSEKFFLSLSGYDFNLYRDFDYSLYRYYAILHYEFLISIINKTDPKIYNQDYDKQISNELLKLNSSINSLSICKGSIPDINYLNKLLEEKKLPVKYTNNINNTSGYVYLKYLSMKEIKDEEARY